MPWVKIDDSFTEHPKARLVGDPGLALFLRGVCYASRWLTDGFLPADVVADWLRPLGRQGKAVLDAMLQAPPTFRVGLWEPYRGGYLIHDYLHYSPSRAEVEARREWERERKKKSRGAGHAAVGRDRSGLFTSPRESQRDSHADIHRDGQRDSQAESPGDSRRLSPATRPVPSRPVGRDGDPPPSPPDPNPADADPSASGYGAGSEHPPARPEGPREPGQDDEIPYDEPGAPRDWSLDSVRRELGLEDQTRPMPSPERLTREQLEERKRVAKATLEGSEPGPKA